MDQIVFILPANTTLNCTVSIQVRAGGVLSNATSIAVSNTDTCSTGSGGGGGGGGSTLGTSLTQDEINRFSAANAYKAGSFMLNRTTTYAFDLLTNAQSITKKRRYRRTVHFGYWYGRGRGVARRSAGWISDCDARELPGV